MGMMMRQISDGYFNDTGGIDNQGAGYLPYSATRFDGDTCVYSICALTFPPWS